MTPSVVRCALAMCVASAVGSVTPVRAQELGIPQRHGTEHTLVGALERVDSVANRILVRTPDGVEYKLSTTWWTSLDGSRCPAALIGLPQYTGADIIVVFTGDGVERTATAISCFGPDTLKVTEGTLVRIDQLTRRIEIRTAHGDQAVFHLADEAMFDTGGGLVRPAEFTTYQGEQVVAHYTVLKEHRIVHLLRLNRGTANCRLGDVPSGSLGEGTPSPVVEVRYEWKRRSQRGGDTFEWSI